jgi:adenosylcobinamide kinase/adenosylcobinamide-phosphate guanylyltransferase
MRHRTLTFVIGGVRSGKSRYAQQIAVEWPNAIFIATATASDADMRARIERHRLDRPVGWRTLEVPLDLHTAIADLRDTTPVVIVDCLTVYLANVMGKTPGDEHIVHEAMDRLCSALEATKRSLIVVSNEVGGGVHPPTALGRLYCDLLGELNQRVAGLADNVILMVAGIPCVIKGQQPSLPPSDAPFVQGSEAPEILDIERLNTY